MARKRMKRGSRIDFAQVAKMSFRTFVWNRIGSEVEVKLEDGELELRRKCVGEPDGALTMTSTLADELTRLFAACGVGSWKRHYEPEGLIVFDGCGWDLTFTFEDGSIFESEGSNAWPERFVELEEGLLELFN